MRTFLFLATGLSILLISGCSSSPHNAFIQDATRIEVYSYDGEQPKLILSAESPRQVEAMRKSIDFSDYTGETCEPQGFMWVIQPQDTLTMNWNTSTGCEYVSYTFDGKSYQKNLTPSGIILIGTAYL
ncbi:MAG: hypothetical protein AAGI38_00845 [Bacteroidota bacterium]